MALRFSLTLSFGLDMILFFRNVSKHSTALCTGVFVVVEVEEV